jgi:hypothetical protein
LRERRDGHPDPGEGRTRRLQKPIASARRYQQRLERRPWVAFSLASVRRFNKIDGKNLALAIALNLFVAVIPLIIIGYAFIQAFNPQRNVGNLIVGNLHLTRDHRADRQGHVHQRKLGQERGAEHRPDLPADHRLGCERHRAGRLRPGLHHDPSARHLEVPARRRVADLAAGGHRRRPDAAVPGRLPSAWLAIVAGAVLVALEFGFFLLSPRLLLDLPFALGDLIPGAAICTGAAIVVHAVAALFMRNWFGAYGHAYGGFGISLALVAFTGIIASFWVWIAAVMGVWWERKAGSAAVAKMKKLSADISAS